MKSPEVDTVLWDLDGTLLDSFGVFEEVLADVLPAYQRPMPTTETLQHNFHGTLRDSINVSLGGVDDKELDRMIEDFLRIQNTHYEVIDHHLFKDALDLADRFHRAGKRQVLVTNRDHMGRLNASPRSIVERSVLSKFIDKVVSGDDGEHRKPKPEVVEEMLKSGELDPGRTLVIGDSYIDGEFAQNLGACGILISRQEQGIVHLDRMSKDWRDTIQIVRSLRDVQV